MPAAVDLAIVIRLWDFSETSQTAWLFTRAHGMVRALAKGSRRPRAAFSGGLDLLTLGEAVFIAKPASELALLTEWDLREVFWAARRSLDAHRVALYLADLVGHAVTDHDPHPELFDALADGLRALELPDRAPETALRVQWAVLQHTGHKPALDRDARTGQPLTPARAYGLSYAVGGLVPDPGPGDHPQGLWRVRSETVDALRAADTGDQNPIPPDAARRGARLLSEYTAALLGREPPTARTLGEVLADPPGHPVRG